MEESQKNHMNAGNFFLPLLNQYHKNVFKNLKNLMNKSEIEELREACSAI